ncbi:MAG: hydantoinase B/oxoprolinase family protein, partial [Firmicutes bacterium]|nr:hydantoinase B/oxoprolinase family protein [Bacillota bacterium]
LRIYRDGKLISDNPKPRNIPLKSGDVVELRTAGAGGYGPVQERDPDIIKQELKDGIIDEKWISDAGLDPNNFR